MNHKIYANGCRVFYTDHADYLYHWLEEFLKESKWNDEYVQDQAKAIITTICLIENIDVDTSVWDRIIWDLFTDCKISDQIEVNDCDVDLEDTKEMVALNEFDNLMCELLV